MTVKKFETIEDYERISSFLTDCYRDNKNMVCWLPERFDDLLFRIDTLYRDERGRKASSDYIYIFEEGHEIVGVIIPDGDSFNSSIKSGHEHIFGEMLYGVINRLKTMSIENAYINSYDWRKTVYNRCGFETEDSIGFWHKKIADYRCGS